MKNKKIFLGFSLIFASILAIQYWVFFGSSQEMYTDTRVIRYKFTVQNKGMEFIPEAKFWAFAPVKRTAFQTVKEIKVSVPNQQSTDSLGNQKMQFNVKGLAPYASKIVSVDVVLGIAESPQNIGSPLDQFVQPERYIESDNPEIMALAKSLVAADKIETLKNAYDWIGANLSDSGYMADDKGAVFALQTKKGDCTEYAYLFAALARANNIPSRVISGYVHGNNALLQAKEYHNWVEVFVDNRWRVVDPEKKRFMENENHYIATNILGGRELAAESSAQQFFGTKMSLITIKMER